MRSSRWTPIVIVTLACVAPARAQDGPAGPGTAVLEGRLLVQLQVQDLDRSIAFYTRTLGCRVTERRDDLEFAHTWTAACPASSSGSPLGARSRRLRERSC
jgi:hypothetical protein